MDFNQLFNPSSDKLRTPIKAQSNLPGKRSFLPLKICAFTLLEVLIAMVIFGTTVTFLLRNINEQQRVHLDISIKTIAHWVALNKMAETKMEKTWPNIGVTRGDIEMRNIKWFWLQTVSKTTEPELRQIEIEVRYLETDENATTRFVGFIANKEETR